MDPFQGLAKFLLGKLEQSAIALWLKFLFEILFSAIASFLFVCGSVLVATKSWPLGAGFGMVTAAVCMVALFRKEQTKLTRGMLIVLPGAEAAKEISTDLQTIQKPEK